MSSPQSPEYLAVLAAIRKRAVEDGECWNWTGAVQRCGATPTMRWQGKVGAVRRFLLLARGVNQPGMLATYTCGNAKCVNPEHTAWALRRTVQRRTTTEQGHQQTLVRRKKVADNARTRAKLSEDLARQVREAEGFQYEIAKRFGVAQSTVSKIKRGVMWRSYGGDPFAGLGARS
jgi:predicted XRE-type DNA-binding protein